MKKECLWCVQGEYLFQVKEEDLEIKDVHR